MLSRKVDESKPLRCGWLHGPLCSQRDDGKDRNGHGDHADGHLISVPRVRRGQHDAVAGRCSFRVSEPVWTVQCLVSILWARNFS